MTYLAIILIVVLVAALVLQSLKVSNLKKIISQKDLELISIEKENYSEISDLRKTIKQHESGWASMAGTSKKVKPSLSSSKVEQVKNENVDARTLTGLYVPSSLLSDDSQTRSNDSGSSYRETCSNSSSSPSRSSDYDYSSSSISSSSSSDSSSSSSSSSCD